MSPIRTKKDLVPIQSPRAMAPKLTDPFTRQELLILKHRAARQRDKHHGGSWWKYTAYDELQSSLEALHGRLIDLVKALDHVEAIASQEQLLAVDVERDKAERSKRKSGVTKSPK